MGPLTHNVFLSDPIYFIKGPKGLLSVGLKVPIKTIYNVHLWKKGLLV